MNATKAKLIEVNGCRCMLCGQEVPYRQITWHHIKWRCISKKNHEPIDNSYENGLLLCLNDHAYVHTLEYDSDEYKKLMEIAKKNKKPL